MAIHQHFVRRGLICVLSCLLLAALAGAYGTARAALPPTFTVNSTADIDAAPPLNNGVCQTTPANNVCTLRAAIMKANHWPGGHVIIILPALSGGAKYRLTLPPTNADDETGGDLNIITPTTIIGDGAANTIIDGSGITTTDNVLLIDSVSVTIGGVTIEGGHTGAVEDGGGIFNRTGQLTLNNSAVISNTSGENGGGIFNDFGALTVTNSIVSHNLAGLDGGGIEILGGVTILNGVTVSGNTSPANGGGVVNYGPDLFGIVDSTISDNQASTGGGIYNQGLFSVVNSTISDNFADGSGGGIYNFPGCCTVNMVHATLAGNLANQAVAGGTGGGIFNGSGSGVRLENTLLNGNARSTAGPDVLDDCAGTVTSVGYNLFSTTAGCTISGGTHDLTDTVGLTGPLQNNGGPTFTNALLPGSPAIDAIPNLTNGCGTVSTTDQRGARRPAFGAHSFQCDIGAFELQQTLDLPLVRK